MRKIHQAGLTFVELMVVMTIVSVLVTFAVPAFTRYMKASKATEIDIVMKKMSEGAKSYFASEQRYNAADGAEPWHVAGAGSSAQGLPVPWQDYVFPGAGGVFFNSAEPECQGGAPGVAGAPTGGKKQVPCQGIAAPTGSLARATQNKLLVQLNAPLYFKYFYESEGQGIDATATVSATADFATGGAAHHASQFIFIDDTQEVFITPAAITNEFE